MSRDFCQHLELYGESYQAASKAYKDCLAAMDEVLAGDRDPALLGQLEPLLNKWETRTRNLRSTFTSLVNKGRVLLPREDQNTTPVCAHCGHTVPRLEFPEFQFQEDGAVLFRGRQLVVQEPVPA
jgi:hypothetical protein